MNSDVQYPKMVMVIRHGEKPGDLSDDKDGGPHLSILGSARAAALPSLFTPDPAAAKAVRGLSQLTSALTVDTEGRFTGVYDSSKIQAGFSRFPTPDFLFAAQPDNVSQRPVETITPLAQALQCYNSPGLKIRQEFANTDEGIRNLTSEILYEKPEIYAGKVILICWHHGKIPQLVKELNQELPLPWSKWPPAIFDLVFCITWKDGRANLDVASQLLLQGDPQFFSAGSITPVFDAPMEEVSQLPQNFRSMNAPESKSIKKGRLASGSAQFSPKQLDHMIKREFGGHPLTVVDLRQESHGFLKVDPLSPHKSESEIAVGWFAERDWINVARDLPSIKVDETERLRLAAKSENLQLYAIGSKTPMEAGIGMATLYQVLPGGTYHTEEMLLQEYQEHNIAYLRLPTTDRCRPRDAEVDQFIDFEALLKEARWLHFHCRAGDGRTTTFMAMHDIYHNAPGDSLDDILARQHDLGGIDLRKPKPPEQFESPFEEERLVFLENFYKYVSDVKSGNAKSTWSEWLLQNAK